MYYCPALPSSLFSYHLFIHPSSLSFKFCNTMQMEVFLLYLSGYSDFNLILSYPVSSFPVQPSLALSYPSPSSLILFLFLPFRGDATYLHVRHILQFFYLVFIPSSDLSTFFSSSFFSFFT